MGCVEEIMNWNKQYEKWAKFKNLELELVVELEKLKGNEKELEDRFYKNLEFGTGGMRGEIGVGTNRMNIYMVRKASLGLATYISSFGEDAKKRGVVIAYDSRHKSPEFSMEAAKTIASQGIQTYVFEELRPTPELSFAVRHLHAFSGIVITASHNPPVYNGYKVYAEDGGQLPPDSADKVIKEVNNIENELTIEVESEEYLKNAGLIKMIGEEMDLAYTENLLTISVNRDMAKDMGQEIKVVFTPLHGTANIPVRNGLAALGYKNITIVEEQELPDPNFSTVKSPNPEEHAAFELAIRKGKEIDADILIGTDPDADRLGVVVKDVSGEYVVLTGNQTGALFLEYLLSQKREKGLLPSNGIVLKTIVTSEIGRTIASSYGLETEDTLTGFKFIGEKIKEYEQNGKYSFQFGYEESYGYLIGDFVRDKDAVQAAILAVEVCAYYKKNGMSIYEGLLNIFEKYGYYQEALESLTLKGKAGTEKIESILTSFRSNAPTEMAGKVITVIEDYKSSIRLHTKEGTTEEINLPKSNVIKYTLEDGSWFCLRPSGTEPKVKFYFGVRSTTLEQSKQDLVELQDSLMAKINEIL